jgi:hypothetical protein
VRKLQQEYAKSILKKSEDIVSQDLLIQTILKEMGELNSDSKDERMNR